MSNQLKHLAIIMDGNRRWAKSKGLPKLKGHTEGGKNLKDVGELVLEEDIPYLTVFALSTENLKERSERELNHLFSLFERLINHLDELLENDVKLNTIGDLSKIPEDTRETIQKVEEETKENESLTLTLAINYGGRDEITRAARRVMESDVKPEDLDEGTFGDFLDTGDMPPVDLLIRTGARKRISNFLIWQAAYAEYFFTDTLWPAFDQKDLDEAIEFFNTRERNFGA
ncbi:MAG: polyprenyl diphosphate synthase [Candidatus Magasanikbacteria bacterium]